MSNPGSKRHFPAGAAVVRSLLVVFAVAIVFVPPDAAALFSLLTGPSEKQDEIPVAAAAAVPDMVPEGLKVLADRDFQVALESEIAAARSEITLAAYHFAAGETPADRPRAVAERLAEAAGRGVKVEVILEIGRESAAVTRANRRAARMLGRRGVKVYVDGSGTTMHTRFVVIDRRLVFIGSHDLTEPSLGQYREASLLVDSPAMAAALLGGVESLKPVPYVEAPPRRPTKRAVRSRPSRSR